MSRRYGHELEREPHHVYVHFGKGDTVLYVGRTQDPCNRPTDRHGSRAQWMDQSVRLVVSPPMPFDAAHWVERLLIQELNPAHNRQVGDLDREEQDPRIEAVMAVEGCDRNTAKWGLPYLIDAAEQAGFGSLEEYLEERRRTRGLVDPDVAIRHLFDGMNLDRARAGR